ncbi:hypothetical protein OE749_15710 [Aestuariibacter sp. AA17]|uniref:PEP-CTERM protein-sorting domain-containing protein n=1 Tax=Fluctibacter corallii TaxID=2984329 RepID=A0ABT3ABS7_9ALTE|nr:hypothetical protein [Aestuariibacter sp. AA17]MCV2886139.1 hypothetical protein [Aestuariibacter sp. AA17]
MWFRKGFLLASLILLVTKADASLIHSSASLGVSGDTGISIGADQYIGSRFTLDDDYAISSIGAHLSTSGSFGAVWVALVELSSQTINALPSFSPQDIESHALAFGLLDTNGVAVDSRANVDVSLGAGHYAVIVGGSNPGSQGVFGATNSGNLVASGTDFMGRYHDSGQILSPDASFFTAPSEWNGTQWSVSDVWRDDGGSLAASAPRFVVEGVKIAAVSEPSMLVLMLLTLGMLLRARKAQS